MLPQFQMVRDFDYYEQEREESKPCSSLIFRKQDFLVETQDNQLETKNTASISRSLKSKNSSFQTSFSNPFMKPHILAFQNSYKKFIENCYPFSKKSEFNHLSQEVFAKREFFEHGRTKINELISNDKKYLMENQRKQFIIDLSFEEKLNEFLSKMCGIVPSCLNTELIFVANMFWQAYIPRQQFGLTEEQISNLVNELLEFEITKCYLKKLENLSLKRASIEPEISEQQVEEHLKEFLRKLGTTILLIVEEYFNNPYSKIEEQQESIKRSFNFRDISNDQFSDDEDQITFRLKKRKLQ